MKAKIDKKAKHLIVGSMVATLPILSNVNISNADINLESEFTSFINKYDVEDIIVENGVSIRSGEILDLSKYPGWEMSNDETVDISEEEVVTPIEEGTVFLGNEINGKLHIVEIYVSDNNLNTSLRNQSVDRDYYKVFIDAGHGGSDPGNTSHGHKEDEINLAISKLVEDKLSNKDIEIDVMMSRSSDKYLSLNERAEMANEYGADVFVSIHNNAANVASASGIETFYHNNKSSHKPLASEVQNNAVNETGARNRGVKSANYVVLRETDMTSALFEGGFMTNEQEAEKLADPSYQNKLATAISNGIETYLVENIKLNDDSDTSQPPVEETLKSGVVTASSLNVRSGYGTNYSVIGKLSKDTKVEIVESKNGWYKIKYNGSYGYVSSDYIKVEDCDTETPQPPVEETLKSGIVTASSLNVRSGYGTNHSVIGKLSKNDKVEIVESKNGWYKIKYNGSYGYVSSDYIKEENSDTETPQPPVEETLRSGVVTATSLNVRSGYGTNYSVIGKLSKNTKVEIVESKSGWHKIKYNGNYGYVSSDYIKEQDTDTETPQPPVEETVKSGVVTATSLNVRSGYGTNYSVIGRLSKSTKVEIVESKNGWHKIKYNGNYGYVSADYIKVGSTDTSTPEEKKIGVVTANVLNMRSGAGTNYSIVGKLSKGTNVEIIESKNGWYKVKYSGKYGYVLSDYIKS